MNCEFLNSMVAGWALFATAVSLLAMTGWRSQMGVTKSVLESWQRTINANDRLLNRLIEQRKWIERYTGKGAPHRDWQ